MKNQHYYYLLLLNIGMLCISTSGPLGRFIALPPPLIIWCRAAIAFVLLGGYCYWKKDAIGLEFKQNWLVSLLSGSLLSFHWVTYFFALQWSSVAIGMLSMFTFPIITVLLEPLFFKTKLAWIHLLFGILILTGISFLTPTFNLDSSVTQGVLMGLISAVSYALRNLILKKYTLTTNGSILMFFQMGVTLLVLFPVLFIYPLQHVSLQLPYLIMLGLITTAIGHTLFLNSLKYFTVGTASIMSSIQPIFGIVIAMVFLDEIPHANSIVGGVIILITVIIESLRSRPS
jgi:drug/metabolite transporter (DMT)-like permease|tara:strand:- start:4484 stop:5344 length:861 start_codon:yes stop_codon:yes gene_type:complete